LFCGLWSNCLMIVLRPRVKIKNKRQENRRESEVNNYS
jgi:hypothetical protein